VDEFTVKYNIAIAICTGKRNNENISIRHWANVSSNTEPQLLTLARNSSKYTTHC